MCQLDGILLGMTINLFIKHDSACLYFPLPKSSSLNCNFYHLFLYSRKNNPDESFHSLPYETLSSDPLKGNCSWKVWTVPVFSLILANIKPPLQKSYFYCHTLIGDFFPLWLFPCLFPLSSRAQLVEICHFAVVQQSGRQQIWILLPVWP